MNITQDMYQQTKEIAPSVGIFAVLVVALLAGSSIYQEHLLSQRAITEVPIAGSAERRAEQDLRRELQVVEAELEELSAELVEGSGFGLWNLEQELNAITAETIKEFEL